MFAGLLASRRPLTTHQGAGLRSILGYPAMLSTATSICWLMRSTALRILASCTSSSRLNQGLEAIASSG